MPAPLPRITDVAERYRHGDRVAVSVVLNTGQSHDMILTKEQFTRTSTLIAEQGSAPVPTGEHA